MFPRANRFRARSGYSHSIAIVSAPSVLLAEAFTS
jgi:hypothetical protein